MQVELRNVDFSYAASGGNFALADICLSLNAGETVLVLGHSGAGKSTLLHMAAGLLKPTSGTVVFDDFRDRAPTSLALQQPERQLFCGSVFDEVAFGLRQTGRPRKLSLGSRTQETPVRQQAEAALLAVGLDPHTYAARHPQQLSGGEKRRLAIACCLAMKPWFMLLDEPLAGLDARGRRALIQLLGRLREDGTGVVVTSHAVEPLMSIADRVILLREGCIVGDGSPGDILGNFPLLSTCGIEPPGIAVVARRLQERGWPAMEWSTPDRLAEAVLGHLDNLDGHEVHQELT